MRRKTPAEKARTAARAESPARNVARAKPLPRNASRSVRGATKDNATRGAANNIGATTSGARIVARRDIKNNAARIVARAELPTQFGRFTISGIEGRPGEEAVAIQHGVVSGPLANGGAPTDTRVNGSSISETGRGRAKKASKAPLVRVHSQCLTGDVFGSQRCDCRAQLEFSLRKIAKENSGIVLYLPQEGRGIGLINKLKAYELQDQGLDTVEANTRLGFEADSRDYDFAASALKALGVSSVRLLSNNPDKVRQLERGGIRVAELVPCRPPTSHHSRGYLQTKKDKLGHILAGL
jgi:3,4-dihydroxy 2-butanone 4-phosphate synthase / GTP cyclohydrolase II